jgi:hypothetical protein
MLDIDIIYTHADSRHHLCTRLRRPLSSLQVYPYAEYHRLIYVGRYVLPSVHLYTWRCYTLSDCIFFLSLSSDMPSVSTDRPLIFLHIPSTHHVDPINPTQAIVLSKISIRVTHTSLWFLYFRTPLFDALPFCIFLEKGKPLLGTESSFSFFPRVNSLEPQGPSCFLSLIHFSHYSYTRFYWRLAPAASHSCHF